MDATTIVSNRSEASRDSNGRAITESNGRSTRKPALSVNGWLRSAGESFDLSLAYELLGGFSGPEGREGLAALLEKRAPRFAAPVSSR